MRIVKINLTIFTLLRGVIATELSVVSKLLYSTASTISHASLAMLPRRRAKPDNNKADMQLYYYIPAYIYIISYQSIGLPFPIIVATQRLKVVSSEAS